MLSKHWLGSDALKLVKYPPGKWTWKIRIFMERVLWKLFEFLIDEHRIVHPRLSKYLIDFGIPEKKITVKPMLPLCYYCVNSCSKIKHDGINIAYYYPGDRGNRKFKRHTYGLDIIEQIISMFPQVNWIHLDGKKNICVVYPILDAYIRPSRHDGLPRIILECLALDIPYYWGEEFKPTVRGVRDYVEKIITGRG